MNKQELERKIEQLEAQLQDLKKHVVQPTEDALWRRFKEFYIRDAGYTCPPCPVEAFSVLDKHLAEKVFHAWKTYQFRVSFGQELWGVREEAVDSFCDKFHEQLQAEACGNPYDSPPGNLMLESAFEQAVDDDDLMKAIKTDLGNDTFFYAEEFFNELIEAYFIYYENKYFTGGSL